METDKLVDDENKRIYLEGGGWIINSNGWWHPPHCLASWPLQEAYVMAQHDEQLGLRMKPEEVERYLRG